MLVPKVEFLDERDAVPRSPVKKQIWNGTEFVTMYQHKLEHKIDAKVYAWLKKTYGRPGQYVNGCYWDHRGEYTVMDEKVYMFYKLKWGSR